MTAPKHAPWFCDAIGGTETTAPHTALEMGFAIDALASMAKTFPDWIIDWDEVPQPTVKLSILAHVPSQFLEIRAESTLGDCGIIARPDPSGWVRITAWVAGNAVLEAYLDRPYEQYALWPPGADADPQVVDAPGSMSKRLWWLSLDSAAWPVLKPLAPQGRLNAKIVES